MRRYAMVALLIAACNQDDPTLMDLTAAPGDMSAAGDLTGGARCPVCSTPVMDGELADPALIEASGLAASRAHPGSFWANNDSGDGPRLFLLDGKGATLGQVTLTGATAVDWEDLGIGPCGGDTCLFAADIGDNAEQRTDYAIYKLVEPATVGGAVTAERLAARYSDGSHNAETLLVHPVTGALTVVTKNLAGASGIYELVGDTLVRAGEITPPSGTPLITGGGTRAGAVMLRTYTHVFYYPLEAGMTVAQALAGQPCPVPFADETQGEAIAGTARGFVTVSEGKNAPLNRVDCAP